jgi:hypothetical protein
VRDDTAHFHDLDLATEPGATHDTAEDDAQPVDDFASASTDTSSTQSESSREEEEGVEGEFIQNVVSHVEDFDRVVIANAFVDPTDSQSQSPSEQEEQVEEQVEK